MKRNSYHRLSRVLSLGGFCHRIISKDVRYYVISGTSPLGHLYSRDTSRGRKILSLKNIHIIFVFVTSIEGTPPFRGKGHYF